MKPVISLLNKYNPIDKPSFSRFVIRSKFLKLKAWKLFYKPIYNLINKEKLKLPPNLPKDNSEEYLDYPSEGETSIKPNTIKHWRNSIFNLFEISEEEKSTIKSALNLISKSITVPTKISETPALHEIFNLIPEINTEEKLKCLFSILFAEVSRHKGDILLEKLFLEDALRHLSKTFGSYSIVLLPLSISLSNANLELGLIDDCYTYLNKAFKVAYFNEDFNSVEVLEVLNKFVSFSKYINETIEEGVYSEFMGNIIQQNLQSLDEQSKKFKAVLNKKENNNNNNENENDTDNGKNYFKEFIKKFSRILKNTCFVNYKNLPFEDKLEILIQMGYMFKHVDQMTTYGKIGKNTENIIRKFNYCDELLENMGILNKDKRTLNFDVILNDLNSENTISDDDEYKLEESFIYFYLNPDLKSMLNFKTSKNKSENNSNENNNNNGNKKEESIQDSINNNNKTKKPKHFSALQKALCDVIYHRYQILRFLQPENKHKPLYEAYNLIESNPFIYNSREKSEYQLNIIVYLLQVFSRADDQANFNKYYDKFFEILKTITKEKRIVYANRILQMMKLTLKANKNSPCSEKLYESFADKILEAESVYIQLFELTPEILNDKLNEVNFIFSDYYYCIALMLEDINIDDSVISMTMASHIYKYKLGIFSENFKESMTFINARAHMTTLDDLDGES